MEALIAWGLVLLGVFVWSIVRVIQMERREQRWKEGE